MYNKIKRELHATDCESFKSNFTPLIDRLPCFGCQMLQKWSLKLGRMFQTAHQNVRFNALRLYCSKLNPACLCYDFKLAKCHKVRWAIQLLNHLLGLPNQASSRYFQERSRTVIFILKFFPYGIVNLLNCFCFHRTLGISPKDLEGFKTEIAFSFTRRSLARWRFPQIWTLIWSLQHEISFHETHFVIRCAFWLVSRKVYCLERVLRKSFGIKKLINKISLYLSN